MQECNDAAQWEHVPHCVAEVKTNSSDMVQKHLVKIVVSFLEECMRDHVLQVVAERAKRVGNQWSGVLRVDGF